MTPPSRSRRPAPSPAALWSAAVALASAAVAIAAHADPRPASAEDREPPILLPPNPQAPGDPVAGLQYLLYGDYIGSGVPRRVFDMVARGGPAEPVLIDRVGLPEGLPHALNAFEMPSGAEVVAAVNCLGCHAQVLNGELVIGLGNSLSDWTDTGRSFVGLLRAATRLLYPPDHPERLAAEQFLRGAAALEGETATPFKGVNPAFRLEEVAAAHRNPADLSWTDDRVYDVPERRFASDVPAWWNVQKKNALYYNGLGRGDFSKLIQQINVVGIEDKHDAARINAAMPDLLAFIHTLEPPAHPGPIDLDLADEGQAIFHNRCADCHGTYGDELFSDDWTYPNRVVRLDKIGTDPEYARALTESGLHDWFNTSWYATTEPTAHAEPQLGYIAPPLDGVWITAPYFHNGSVPTLEGVLDSSKRPTYWRRTFRDDDYNPDAPGWNHTVEDGPVDTNTYDTTIPGYGNGGHTYGDTLSERQRKAVVEYLKTL